MISALLIVTPSGMPGSNALRHANNVGMHAGVLHRKPLASAPNAALHFVHHQQDAVLVADAAQFLHEDRRSDHVSAFALDRLDKNRRDFFRRKHGLKQFVFDVARAAEREFLRILRTAHTAPVHIGITHVRNSRHERRETPFLLRLRSRQRKRAHGPSVKSAEKSDHLLPLGVIARQFQSALNGLGAGVSVIKLVRPRHRRNLRKPLGQRHHALVIKVGARHVNQFARLLLNRGDHVRMAMAGRNHGNARGKIEELIAIHVFDHNAAAALGNHRIRTRIRRRNIFFVARENAPGVRARKCSLELGSGGQSFGGHGVLQIVLSSRFQLFSGSIERAPSAYGEELALAKSEKRQRNRD